jgi:diguanylate cyclase (GGDEF)-like protein
MDTKKPQILPTHEDVRIRNYLATELAIAKFRWLVIGFLFVYINILHPPEWPVRLFNAVLLVASLYNLGIYLHIKKTRDFSPCLTYLLMYGDMFATSVGMYFTGGGVSAFLFIWYLTLFTTGIRFGYVRSLTVQVPMALLYVLLLLEHPGVYAPEFLERLVLGLFAIASVAFYGSLFSREERFTFRVMEGIHRKSITDGLTGLVNYAYFMEQLTKEHARAVRDGSDYAVILFDLDLFKRVNDTYGHERGNVLLRAVAGILQANARTMDTVARYGGEEFIILMPNSNGREMEAAERIRKRIEETKFSGVSEGALFITVSCGVCTYPRNATSVHEVLENADKGLYAAKMSGRNRACYYGQRISPQGDAARIPGGVSGSSTRP